MMAKPVSNPTRTRETVMTRQIMFDRSMIDIKNRTVEASISSEVLVQRWWGTEVLGHNPGEPKLERIQTVGSFLFAHGRDPNHGLVPVGPIVRVWLDEEKRQLRAILKFDESEKSEELWQKVLNGSIRGISIRYATYKWLVVEAGKVERGIPGPCEICIDWEPIEISLEPTPADWTVGVGRSEGEGGIQPVTGSDTNPMQRSDGEMRDPNETRTQGQSQETQSTASVTPAVPQPVDVEAERQAAIAAERKRVNDITAMCREFEIDPKEYIEKGVALDEARASVLTKLAEQRKALPTAQVVEDEQTKIRAAMTDALMLRAGIPVEKPVPGHETFRGARLLDLARECVERATGKRLGYVDEEQLIRSAITGTSDFPLILSNVVNQSVAKSWESAPTTFQLWTSKGNVTDFKPASRVNLSEADELLPMTEHGEFVHAEVTERGYTVQVGTYGRSFSMTRKALINDDLGILSTIPARYAAAARRMINKMSYAVLVDNGKLPDNKALFHDNHGNLAQTGAPPSVESLGAGRAAMRRHKDVKGKESLNIVPRYIIVPPELETLTEQLIRSIVDPAKSNATPNPFEGRLLPVCDAQLTDAKAWYLAADPNTIDTVEVTYLNGKDTPTIESAVVFDMLGIKWRIFIDVGVKALDFRGLYKNPGE